LDDSFRAHDVHANRQLESLVKLDRGRRMEDDGHTIGEDLLVGLTNPQLMERYVSTHRHQFVQSLRAFLPQPVKNLQKNKNAYMQAVSFWL
jgi:hypothetical protein